MKTLKILLILSICFICYSSILANKNLNQTIASNTSQSNSIYGMISPSPLYNTNTTKTVTTTAPTLSQIPSNTPVPTIIPSKHTTLTPSVVSLEPTQTVITTTLEPTANTPVDTDKPKPVSYVLTPSAPGYIIYKNDESTACIDCSNTSHGYLAIKYSGNNTKVKVQISFDDTTYNYDLTPDDTYTYYPLQFGNGSYKIGVFENISGTSYMPILSETIDVNIKKDNEVFLYPNQYVWFTKESATIKKAAELCAGLTTDIEKISVLFNYVVNNISYDYNKANTVSTGYLPDVDSILSSKTGICFDYAAVFASMCRSQNIPAKLITGYVSSGTYHAWNEVYTSEKGWITVYMYLNKTGFNLVDPTFYSNMKNAKEAASYIGNGSNYQNYHIY